jgi:hypothetical protein
LISEVVHSLALRACITPHPSVDKALGRDFIRLSGILERLGSDTERWWSPRIEKLSKGRLLGRFFAASRDWLRRAANALGVHHLANLGGCAARLRGFEGILPPRAVQHPPNKAKESRKKLGELP